MKITANTRIAGVVGNPVRHSLSPIIHNAWIEAAGLDAVYLAFEPPKDAFKRFLDGLCLGGLLGLNVTIPFKEDAVARADKTRKAARRARAANLLLFEADGITADNTDGLGLIHALGRPGAGRAVVLGAGGAARSAVMTLLQHGYSKVTVLNRTLAHAELIATFDDRIEARRWTDAKLALEGAAALVNATSLGMVGQPDLELSLDPLPQSAIVMDMVYRPLCTGLLSAAERRGNPTADGLDMLIGQAIPSFEAFFGRPPPNIDVRALCLEGLDQAE